MQYIFNHKGAAFPCRISRLVLFSIYTDSVGIAKKITGGGLTIRSQSHVSQQHAMINISELISLSSFPLNYCDKLYGPTKWLRGHILTPKNLLLSWTDMVEKFTGEAYWGGGQPQPPQQFQPGMYGLTKRRRADGPNDGSVRRHTGTDPSAVRRATISLPPRV